MNSRELLSRIQVQSRQMRYRIYRDSVALFCDAILQSLDESERALSVAFVSARQMRSLSRRYLQRDYATDVLSFSYGRISVDNLPFLGEIVIAPEIAVNHASRSRTCPERELKILLVHGILHLLGYNHETDQGQMKRFQNRLQRRKFFAQAPPLADLDVYQ
jgi:probable rRNA maturation factor